MSYEDLTDYQKNCFDTIKENVEKFLEPVGMLAPDKDLVEFCSNLNPPPRSTFSGTRFTYKITPGSAGTFIKVLDGWSDNEVDLSGTEWW